jgi:uncharacterized membrane protein YuzA (DUF378 family)
MTQLGKCPACKLIGLLVVIGAINWGLVGAFEVNLVENLLGNWPVVLRIVYILVGIAGVISLISCVKACPCCKKP